MENYLIRILYFLIELFLRNTELMWILSAIALSTGKVIWKIFCKIQQNITIVNNFWKPYQNIPSYCLSPLQDFHNKYCRLQEFIIPVSLIKICFDETLDFYFKMPKSY